jgi:hypothetical protein
MSIVSRRLARGGVLALVPVADSRRVCYERRAVPILETRSIGVISSLGMTASNYSPARPDQTEGKGPASVHSAWFLSGCAVSEPLRDPPSGDELGRR